MCIVAPLKVKTLLTSRRTAVCMLALYCLGVVITFPHAYLNAVFLVWKFDLVSNRTFLGFGYGPNYHKIDLIGGFINTMSIIIPLGVLILSTGLIIVELQRKSLWRQSVTNSGGAVDAAKRDRVVFKVISLLAFLLIVCYLPHACNFTAYAIVPDFSLTGKYVLLYGVMWSVSWISEIINSSCTIFIYYFVSSKYRATLNSLRIVTYFKTLILLFSAKKNVWTQL